MAVKDVGVLVRRPGEAVCRSERRYSGEKGVGVEVVGRKVGWEEGGVGRRWGGWSRLFSGGAAGRV